MSLTLDATELVYDVLVFVNHEFRLTPGWGASYEKCCHLAGFVE